MDACLRMAESLCCPPETITTLLISYTLIQNKKLKKRTPRKLLDSGAGLGDFCHNQDCLIHFVTSIGAPAHVYRHIQSPELTGNVFDPAHSNV